MRRLQILTYGTLVLLSACGTGRDAATSFGNEPLHGCSQVPDVVDARIRLLAFQAFSEKMPATALTNGNFVIEVGSLCNGRYVYPIRASAGPQLNRVWFVESADDSGQEWAV